MTFKERLARVRAWLGEWLWERPNAALSGLTLLQWRSQRRRTSEVMAEVATAVRAAELDTVEGDMQVAVQRPAFNEEIERLLLIPKRSREEERRLLWLQRKVREIDLLTATRGASPESIGSLRMGLMGEVGRPSFGARFMASLAPVLPYVLIVGALAMVTGWGGTVINGIRADRFEAERDSARAERDAFKASRDAYARALGEERAARARDVAAVLEDTARTVESLQRQRARDRARAERERSRREDLATGSVDFNERLRELAEPANAGLPAPAAPAAGGDPASGVSTGARPAAGDERSR